jgi:hypothetical protein
MYFLWGGGQGFAEIKKSCAWVPDVHVNTLKILSRDLKIFEAKSCIFTRATPEK